MSKKTIQYLITFGILVVANLAMLFSETSVRGTSFDDKIFSIEDTTSIQSILIKNKQGEILLERTAGGWKLNKEYGIDSDFRNILFAILNRVRVKRSIGVLKGDPTGSIAIMLDGESREFHYSTDPLATKTYFVSGDQAFHMEVPGYRDNVANIFELKPDQWRNRIILNSSWRTIQRLELISETPLRITFDDKFFEVEEISEVDSIKLIGYLNQFEYFKVNEMISPGVFPDLDSLVLTKPSAQLVIDDFQRESPDTLRIFPKLSGQSYQLITNQAGNMMVVSADRLSNILKEPQDFKHSNQH